MKKNHISLSRIFAALIIAGLCVCCFTTPLAAKQEKNLLISPTRIIFEGKKRFTTVKLINQNNTPKTYQLSIISMRMDEYGKISKAGTITDTERLAQKMIRFSPRRVTVGPNVWQTVRVMVRKPKDLPPGEYRIQFRASPVIGAQDQGRTEKNKNSVGVAVNIEYVFAISIPIIIRHGQGDMTMTAQAPRFIKKKDTYFFETRVKRTGLFSAFYDLNAFFVPMDGSPKIKIGSGIGRSVYATNPDQIVQFPVKNTAIFSQSGQIQIQITDREQKNNPVVFSEQFGFNGLN